MESREPGRGFLEELKRRKVVETALIYGAVALGAAEGTEIVVERLGLPEVMATIVVVVALVGFPVAVLLAWLFEVRPEQASVSAPGLRRWRLPFFLALGGVAALALLVLARGGGEMPVVAVLPVENISPNENDAYFAAGMHEELIGQLMRVSGLRTFSRAQMVHYVDDARSLPTIASELAADYLVNASARLSGSGDRLRLSVDLVDASGATALPRLDYNRELTVSNVLDVQEDVARNVADALSVEILGGELSSAPLPENREALLLYWKGREYRQRAFEAVRPGDRRTFRDLGLELLEQAVDLEPELAPAHANIAMTILAYLAIGGVGAQAPTEQLDSLESRARVAVAEAMRTGPEHALSHTAAAILAYYVDWDLPRALGHADRALAISPREPDALRARSAILRRMGHLTESKAVMEQVLQLQPLDPFWLQELGNSYLATRDLSRAQSLYRRAADFGPPRGFVDLVETHLRAGHVDAALLVAEQCKQAWPESGCGLFIAAFFARDYPRAVANAVGMGAGLLSRRLGDTTRAVSILGGLEGQLGDLTRGRADRCPGVHCYYIVQWLEARAMSLAGLGRRAAALEVARQAQQLRRLEPRDRWAVTDFSEHRLHTWVLLGMHEEALAELEGLLSTDYPRALTREYARAHPALDPLHPYPEFRRLVGLEPQ